MASRLPTKVATFTGQSVPFSLFLLFKFACISILHASNTPERSAAPHRDVPGEGTANPQKIPRLQGPVESTLELEKARKLARWRRGRGHPFWVRNPRVLKFKDFRLNATDFVLGAASGNRLDVLSGTRSQLFLKASISATVVFCAGLKHRAANRCRLAALFC